MAVSNEEVKETTKSDRHRNADSNVGAVENFPVVFQDAHVLDFSFRLSVFSISNRIPVAFFLSGKLLTQSNLRNLKFQAKHIVVRVFQLGLLTERVNDSETVLLRI